MPKNLNTLLKKLPNSLPNSPGVYQMNNAKGHALYVGKARNLKKRVFSYTRPQNTRITRMLQATRSVETVTTSSEEEAVLLEALLIKKLKPPFNIRLRDDKSFPQLLLTDHPAPRLVKCRGAQKKDKKNTFGPFASSALVDDTVSALQHAFLLRTCADHVYQNRTRPCLLYQIKRCAAPCTGKISLTNYQNLVREARAFLRGGGREVQKKLLKKMEAASATLNFEHAASYRDRITALSRIQESQNLHPRHITHADLFSLYRKHNGPVCITAFFVRHGQNRGTHTYFPKHAPEDQTPQILEAFLSQFYIHRTPPPLLLLDQKLPSNTLLCNILGKDKKIQIQHPRRGQKKIFLDQLRTNAKKNLQQHVMETVTHKKNLAQLKEFLTLSKIPKRIEVYDNSHIQGTQAVGAMVVVDTAGFAKRHYRKFNITSVSKGDDYAMIREVLRRPFQKTLVSARPPRDRWRTRTP